MRFIGQINCPYKLIIPRIPTFFNHFSNQIPIGTTSSISASRLGLEIPINCLRECFQAEIFGHSASPPLNGHKKRALRLGEYRKRGNRAWLLLYCVKVLDKWEFDKPLLNFLDKHLHSPCYKLMAVFNFFFIYPFVSNCFSFLKKNGVFVTFDIA